MFNLITRTLKSKDGKTVLGNIGYLSLLQIASYAFPLLTMPYLARVIGSEGYGKIAFATAIIIWVQTMADWGFSYTATRDVAQNRDDIVAVSRIFTNVFWAKCLLVFLSLVILCCLVLIIPSFYENREVIFATFLIVPGQILFPEWFFQAVERMKFITVFNLLLKFIFTLAVFLFIKERKDYIYQPLLLALGYFLCGLISMWLVVIKWHIRLGTPKISNIVKSIKESADVFVNNLMPNLYNSFSLMLLGNFGGAHASGVYDGGNKFLTVFNQLQNVVARAFFPFLTRKTDKHSVYVKISIGSSMIIALFCFLFAPTIVHYMLSEEFIESILVLRILSVSIVFLSVYMTYGANYLIIMHQERLLRKATLWASLLGMAISAPLVYYYDYIGAALTVTISRGLLGLFTYCASKKVR